jgi:hypothetical protein
MPFHLLPLFFLDFEDVPLVIFATHSPNEHPVVGKGCFGLADFGEKN